MSVARLTRRGPAPHPFCPSSAWCADGQVVEKFSMEQPIPLYLFVLAAGEIGSRDIAPRSKVYVEGGVEVLDAATREFAGTEEMIKVGKGLFRPYEWERFDLLVLPPSFPYGGMENPRMVFLMPTVIKGDAIRAQVVAHELAHSWTGNLITNKPMSISAF
ncbi:Peptidase M1 alanine aminopeptidase/leukotriene A4 hydrolase protein [Dioscorea alata]|uniref:Peptidase M1 alanine aminopeptidase/leukotriene A4 hydrolase protein n=1 Tax=Dioscorea alata TaxID=55571 RepID=A0ACB7VM54_DIOAL|nr:Peptidase M1 alanine aminopeptidase/leukotriene A4 hydrolase protein [Dioscorea alata]